MEATIHAGGSVGEASGRHHLLLTKSVSIKLFQNPLRLLKNHGAPNSIYCCNRPLPVGIASRCHRGGFNAVGKHGYRRFKFKFRAKEEAEEGSSGKWKRTWWSDAPEDIEEEEEEELGILDDFIESLWILKVFKSYGWGLPFIIVSWLLATGPKAFLMTLAIPLGQSAVTLAISRLWGKPKKRRPKARQRRAEKRKKPSASPWAGRPSEEERKAAEEGAGRKMGYESWAESNNSSFGGWGEELDELESVQQKPESAPEKAASSPLAQPVPGKGRQPQLRPRRRGATANGKPASGGRLRRESSGTGTPLLLRLLIAVFPFLASWTKMF